MKRIIYLLFVAAVVAGGSMVFGLGLRAGMRRAWGPVDWGEFEPHSLYEAGNGESNVYFERFARQAIGGYSLYLPARCSVRYKQVDYQDLRIESLKAGVRVPGDGWVDLVFRKVGGNYYAFRVSQARDVPSGFYVYALHECKAPAARVTRKIVPYHRNKEPFDTERFVQLESVGWDRLAKRLAFNGPALLSYFNVEVKIQGQLFEAYVNGELVCTLADPTYRDGAVGLQAGRFPGAFVRSITVSGTRDNKHFSAENRFEGFLGGGTNRIILASWLGVPLGLLYIVPMGLGLARLTGCRRGRALLFEAGLLAVAGMVVLTMKGVESTPLYLVVVAALWWIGHFIFISFARGLRVLKIARGKDTRVFRGLASFLASPRRAAVLLLVVAGSVPGLAFAMAHAPGRTSGLLPEQTLTGRFRLDKADEPSVLEVYFRKEQPVVPYGGRTFRFAPQWYALRLSTDPSNPSRFVSSMGEERKEPERDREQKPWVATPGVEYGLRIELRGETFAAYVDNERIDRFTDDALCNEGPAGSVVRSGSGEMITWKPETASWNPGLYAAVAWAILKAVGGWLLVGLAVTRLGSLCARSAYARSALCFAPLPVACVAVALVRPERAMQWIAAAAVLSGALVAFLFARNADRVRFAAVLFALTVVLLGTGVGEFARTTRAAQLARLAARPAGYVSRLFPEEGRLDHVRVWRHYIGKPAFRGVDYEVTLDRPKGLHRVIVLGGSSAYGLGTEVSKTYPRILSTMFEQKEALSIVQNAYEILNAAWPRYTASDAVAHLERDLLQYEPRVVVLHVGYQDANPFARPALPMSGPLAAVVEVPMYLRASGIHLDSANPRPSSQAAWAAFEQGAGLADEAEPTDLIRGRKLEEFRKALNHLADLGEKHGFAIVLVSEAYGAWPLAPDARDPFFERMKTLAVEHRAIKFFDSHGAIGLSGFDDSFSAHNLPSRQGNFLIANLLARQIRAFRYHWPAPPERPKPREPILNGDGSAAEPVTSRSGKE